MKTHTVVILFIQIVYIDGWREASIYPERSVLTRSYTSYVVLKFSISST